MSRPKTEEEMRNEQIIRELYAVAEGNMKDVAKFVSLFAKEGYFWDVAGGMKYYGEEIGVPVEIYAGAFPDMHRELYSVSCWDDTVLVELSLNGTHKGDLRLPAGILEPTNKVISAPCCDVFQLKEGKILSFHCYVAVPILLQQLGVFGNLSAAIKTA